MTSSVDKLVDVNTVYDTPNNFIELNNIVFTNRVCRRGSSFYLRTFFRNFVFSTKNTTMNKRHRQSDESQQISDDVNSSVEILQKAQEKLNSRAMELDKSRAELEAQRLIWITL